MEPYPQVCVSQPARLRVGARVFLLRLSAPFHFPTRKISNLVIGCREVQGRVMLETEQLIELEILAGEELDRLEREELAAADSLAAVAPDKAIGRLSRLDAMQMQEVAKEAQRQRGQRMHQLREAMRRMDTGEYGICTACSEWIDYQRLEARPEILMCGSCTPR
jgi:DnaK suppressor protein